MFYYGRQTIIQPKGAYEATLMIMCAIIHTVYMYRRICVYDIMKHQQRKLSVLINSNIEKKNG